MYKTLVKKIGQDAGAFKEEKMIILFGDNAPKELADYCYIIEVQSVEDSITEEQNFYIDNTAFDITKVGSTVNKNLNDLGHITIKFDGSTVEEQSGTLYVEDKDIPIIKEGSKIVIE